MSHRAEVTVIVIALDEEARIEPTLEAARTNGFRVLVVDGGSSDNTASIARDRGCDVLVRPFTSFAEQRNWALTQAPTSHALFVDADELVHPALADAVRSAIQDGVDGAWIPTLDYFAGRWMLHGGWFPQPHLRLLRCDVARFEGAVHEMVAFGVGRPYVVRLSEPLLHRSHLTVSHYLRKLDRYTTIEAERLRGGRRRLLARGILEASAVVFRRMVLQSGWRDGVHGFIGAGLYATYRFSIYAKAATQDAVDAPTPDAALARLRRQREGR